MSSVGPGRLSVGVVGGGIIGVAVARRLLELRPDLRVTVLEKESRLACHQTGRNSGVVHAGIYYAPGSLKARLCRRGVLLLHDYARSRGIRIENCGKLIIARDERERWPLMTLYQRATANGVPGVRLVNADQLREIEPHAVGLAGIHSPETAIVDFASVTAALAADIERSGGSIETGRGVTGITENAGQVRVRTTGGDYAFDRLVICAGLQGDRVARMAGADPNPQIVPFRGEYYVLRPERRYLVRGLIYPVPDPRYPFLGVHLTRRMDGEILVGPNAVLALAREGYRWRDLSARDIADMLSWPGFHRMARKHWRTGLVELQGSLSRRLFVAKAREFVPSLRDDDVVAGPAGIRAQAVNRNGTLADDFQIDQVGRVTAVRNAPSPGATSSLAIAEYIADRVPFA